MWPATDSSLAPNHDIPKDTSPNNTFLYWLRRHPRLGPIALVALSPLFLGGCHKKAASTKDIRAITHELMAAAQKATGRKAMITIRPEMGRTSAGTPGGLVADNLYITLSDSTQKAALEQSFNEVARQYHLERTANSSSGSVQRFDYDLQGKRTHTIQIVTPVATRPVRAAPGGAEGPRLAILVDDLGHDRASADAVLRLPFPVSVAVLPRLPFSTEVAEEAHRRGDQVLLHLPMESEGDGTGVVTEPVELHVGMAPEEVDQTVGEMLETVPYATGVNNHQGSRATADPALMDAVMRALGRRGLFFIDSRTTAQTVAFDTAEIDGVRAAFRKVFLDDTPTREAILKQLELAGREAREQGWAIAIGHPHPATIAAIAEGVPKLEAQGIHLDFVSDLAQ